MFVVPKYVEIGHSGKGLWADYGVVASRGGGAAAWCVTCGHEWFGTLSGCFFAEVCPALFKESVDGGQVSNISVEVPDEDGWQGWEVL